MTFSPIPMSTVPRPARRLVIVAVSAGLALTVAACGSTSSSSGASGSRPIATATAAGIAATHNQADVTFIDDMTPHHSGAIAMAQLAVTRAGSTQVKTLAAQIAAAQGPEQRKMAAMATAWGVAAPSTDQNAGDIAGSSSSMGNGMSMDTTALEPLSGSAFDKMFLSMMIEHHQSALPMAQTELHAGSNMQAKELAQSIVTSQTAQIAQMKQMLTTV